jgi:hypothetical protein
MLKACLAAPVLGDSLVNYLEAAPQEPASPNPSETTKICFVAGKPSHGPGIHAHDEGCDLLATYLNKNIPGVQAVVHKNGWPEDEAFFENAAAVVVYCDGWRKHIINPHLEQIDEMSKKGVGFGFLHFAVVPLAKDGERFLDWMGGYYKSISEFLKP